MKPFLSDCMHRTFGVSKGFDLRILEEGYVRRISFVLFLRPFYAQIWSFLALLSCSVCHYIGVVSTPHFTCVIVLLALHKACYFSYTLHHSKFSTNLQYSNLTSNTQPSIPNLQYSTSIQPLSITTSTKMSLTYIPAQTFLFDTVPMLEALLDIIQTLPTNPLSLYIDL